MKFQQPANSWKIILRSISTKLEQNNFPEILGSEIDPSPINHVRSAMNLLPLTHRDTLDTKRAP